MQQDGRGRFRGPRRLWLDPGGVGKEVAEAGFQAGGGSEGWVVNAPGDPRMFFRCEAVGRRRIHGRQTQDWLQNNLQGKRGQSLLRARHWHGHPRAGSVPGKGVTRAGCSVLLGEGGRPLSLLSENRDNREIQKAKERNRD